MGTYMVEICYPAYRAETVKSYERLRIPGFVTYLPFDLWVKLSVLSMAICLSYLLMTFSLSLFASFHGICLPFLCDIRVCVRVFLFISSLQIDDLKFS